MEKIKDEIISDDDQEKISKGHVARETYVFKQLAKNGGSVGGYMLLLMEEVAKGNTTMTAQDITTALADAQK